MEKNELRTRLEKAIYKGRKRITDAQWKILMENKTIGEWKGFKEEDWPDFRGLVEQKLEELDRFQELLIAEQEGTSAALAEPRDFSKEEGTGPSEECLRKLGLSREDLITPTPLGERTRARAETLRAYDELNAKTEIPYNRTPLNSAVFLRGGSDGTVPQWVALMMVELWTPAEEVKEAYLGLQDHFSEESKPSKATERTFEVARFVLSQRRYAPKRRWKDLLEDWNVLQLEEWQFTGSSAVQTFHKYYERGMKAMLPRYRLSSETLSAAKESRDELAVFDSWASSFRKTL